MRRNCPRRFTPGIVLVTGVLLTVATMVPAVGLNTAGAVDGHATKATVHPGITAHATRACGPITFEWNTDVSVTYFQIHATGVGCAVAKEVIVKGGKYHGQPPAGWTYVGTATRGSDCDSTYKRGADRVTGYMVNTGEGC
jgi:hypothetical protein